MRLKWLLPLVLMAVPMVSVQAQACPRLQSLVDAAPAGGTVMVPPCTFHETVTVGKALTLDGQNRAIVDGDGVRDRWMWIASSNVTIKNFTMRNANTASQGSAIGTQVAASNVVLDHNDLSGTTNGYVVGIGLSTNSKVTNNQIHGGGQLGIGSYKNTNLEISGNHIYGNNTAGADPYWEAGGLKAVQDSGLRVVNNEVDHNNGPGIWIDILATNVLISGNNVHDQRYNPIFFEVSSNGEITGNTVSASPPGPDMWGCIAVSSAAAVNVHDNTCTDTTYLKVILDNRADIPPNAGRNIKLVNNRMVRPNPPQATNWWQWSATGPLVPGQNGNVDSGNVIVNSLPTAVPTPTPTVVCEVLVRINGAEQWLAKPASFCQS